MKSAKQTVTLCIKLLLFGGGDIAVGLSAYSRCIYAAHRKDESPYCRIG